MTQEEFLAVLRGMNGVDDFTIAEEMYRYRVAQAKKEHRRVRREDLIDEIADMLKMDSDKLTNFLRRSKQVR
jgi:hypothetical protein